MKMSFYKDHIYPHLVSGLGDPKPIREIRERVIPLAKGIVLEVGVGPGVNLPLYDPARVFKVYALEPNSGMVRLAEREKLRAKIDIEFLGLPGERIPLEDGTIDTVVSTFTLCTIPGVIEALKGIRRVLRPNGKFIFFELGLAPDARVQQWQKWSEPIPHWLFVGCHVTRDIPSIVRNGGFRIDQMEAGYLARPKSWTYCFWGTAIPETPPSRI